ncbi:ABC transporter substrate-binding protein [Thermodesulfobacteriota bacterium]
MKKIKLITVIAVTLALVAIPLFCAYAQSGPKPKYGGVLKIIGRRSTTVLGAPYERGLSYPTAAPPVMENLIRMGWKGEALFVLATSFDVKPKEKQIIMGLRKGIKFHDGSDFNAEAVKVNLETKGPRGVQIRSIKSVDVIDEYTARLNLSEFSTSIFSYMGLGSGMMASAKAIKIPATPETRAKLHMVGSGPFTFVDWQRDEFIKYKKFDGYWQKGKPYLDGLEILYISDPVTALAAFQSGQGHVIYEITPKDARDLKAKGHKITYTASGYSVLVGDGLNPDSPFAKKGVREAVEYAIDKKAIAEGLGFGYWEPVTQPCPTGHKMGYVPGLKVRSYDPEKAKQLLKDAGYPNGFQSKIIALTTHNRDALVAIQNFLAAVGIQVKLDLVDRAKYYATVREGWQNSMVFGGASAVPDMAGDFERWYSGKGAFGYNKMLRPAGFDALIAEMLSTYEPAKHRELVQKGVKWMHEDAFVTPLWTSPALAASHKSVKGLQWYENALSQHWTPADAWFDR